MGYRRDYHNDIGNGIYQAVNPNDPEYPPGYLWQLIDMVYLRSSGEPEKMRGYERLGTTDLDGSVAGVFDYDIGTYLVVPTTSGTVWYWDGANWTQSINASTGWPFYDHLANDPNVRWQGCMFYGATTAANILILTNGKSAPKKWNGTAGISTLSADAPALGINPVSWQSRLFLSQGDTLYGSKTNDCEKWTTGDGGVNFQIDRGSGDIVALAAFLGDLIIFKKEKVFRIAGGATLDSTYVREISKAVGTISPNTVKECVSPSGSVLCFMSDSGVHYMYGSDTQGSYNIGSLDDPVKRILTQRSRINQAGCWADWNPDRTEYYLQYPRSVILGPLVTSEGLICNLAQGRKTPRWTQHRMSGMTAGGTFRWQNEQLQIWGNDSGRLFKLHTTHGRDGVAFTARLSTPCHAQGDGGLMKEYGRVFFEYEAQANINITVRYRLGREDITKPTLDTETFVSPAGEDGWGVGLWGIALWGGSGAARGKYLRLDTLRRGRWIQMQMETTELNTWFRVNNYNIEHVYGSTQIIG